MLVQEGKFDKDNLGRTGKDKDYFLQVLREQGCVDEKKVLVMTVDGQGKIYLQKKGEPYQVFHLHWQEQLW